MQLLLTISKVLDHDFFQDISKSNCIKKGDISVSD